MDAVFQYADKNHLEKVLPKAFGLLYHNMNALLPTGNPYEADYREWVSHVSPAMQKPQRQIVFMYYDGDLAGYFQYYINGNLLMMEEIQIKAVYHGTGLFRTFYQWLIRELPDGIAYVEAFAHPQNHKSQEILKHLGLAETGIASNGNALHFRGKYQTLTDQYY